MIDSIHNRCFFQYLTKEIPIFLLFSSCLPFTPITAFLSLPDSSLVLLSAGVIFCLRVIDISFGTLRVFSLVKNLKIRAGIFAFFEAGTFIFALSVVLAPPLEYIEMFGYAAGYGVGTYVGTTIAGRIGSEFIMMRILSREKGQETCQALRDNGFGVTLTDGRGKEGPVHVLFTVVRRNRAEQALAVIQQENPKAFITTETVERAVGGFIPSTIPLFGSARV